MPVRGSGHEVRLDQDGFAAGIRRLGLDAAEVGQVGHDVSGFDLANAEALDGVGDPVAVEVAGRAQRDVEQDLRRVVSRTR